MISKETIDQVLMRNDIENLIGSYISLKRAGSNLKGLCPFHSEKTPSFTVYPADNSFYCFGCGAGGDAITFIRKRENLDYPDAVEFLANRAGITIVRDEIGDKYSRTPKFDRSKMFKMNVDAAKYFNRCLFSDNPEAKAALAYFTEKRGLSVATIKHFGLGFAPNSFDQFSKYMLAKGYTFEELEAGFLCGKSERGTYYDAFRNRVMFPIIDVSGNVIAFGGRVMDDSKPKYKNSSDTPVFHKGNNLFALNFAHKHCADRIILCEGYMDVIAMHAAGFPFSVATLGTAIRPEQARLISRYTKKVILSYDSDEAGQRATDKAIALLEEVGLEVSVLHIEGAKDPDEYIRTRGADSFRALLGESHTKFDFNFNRILKKYDPNIPQQKIEALDALCEVIAGVYSSVEREIYIAEGAKRLSVDPKNLAADVAKKIAIRRKNASKDEAKSARETLGGFGDKVNTDFAKMPRVARLEETVLGLLQLYPEYRTRTFTNPPLLTEDDFMTELGKRVFCFIRNAEAGDGFDSAMLDTAFTPDEVGRIAGMRVLRLRLTDNGAAVFEECVASLKEAVALEKKKDAPPSFDKLNDLLNRKRGQS